MSKSGSGKEIKSDLDLVRAKRINSCLNKAIRLYFKEPTDTQYKKIKHWQFLLFNFYEVYDDKMVN